MIRTTPAPTKSNKTTAGFGDNLIRKVMEAHNFIKDEDPTLSTKTLLAMIAFRTGCSTDQVIEIMRSRSPILTEYGCDFVEEA